MEVGTHEIPLEEVAIVGRLCAEVWIILVFPPFSYLSVKDRYLPAPEPRGM
jgi:hypothetical protein